MGVYLVTDAPPGVGVGRPTVLCHTLHMDIGT